MELELSEFDLPQAIENALILGTAQTAEAVHAKGMRFVDQKLRAGFPSPTLEFYDAGHAIGSAGIMVRGKKETVFFTGDVCFQDQTILKAARFEDVQADVLIMETTRGNREVPAGMTRQTETDRLADAIQRVLATLSPVASTDTLRRSLR